MGSARLIDHQFNINIFISESNKWFTCYTNVVILTLTAFVLFAIDSEALDLFVAFFWKVNIKSATIVNTNNMFRLFVCFGFVCFSKKKLGIQLTFYIIKLAQFMHWTMQKRNSLFESLFLYLTNGLQTLHPCHLRWCEVLLSWNIL